MKIIKLNESSTESNMRLLSTKFINAVSDYIYSREVELLKEAKDFNIEDEKDYSDGYHRGAEEYLKKLAGDISDKLWSEYKEFLRKTEDTLKSSK